MAKRFIDPNWKALRKLHSDLQRAWFYVWDKADEAGVYLFDADYIRLDLGCPISLQDLGKLPECEILPGERVLIKNFIVVMYGKLKPEYNPHKPAFRALTKNELALNLSYNEAYFKLEEEGEEEGEEVLGGLGDFPTMPFPGDCGELPPLIAGSAIQLISLTKYKDVSREQVYGLWTVFLSQNATGNNYYANLGKVHSHFINWIAGKNFEDFKVTLISGQLSETVRQIEEQRKNK